MIKLIFASLFLSFMLTGCAGKSKDTKAEEQKVAVVENAISTIRLTKAEFLAKV